MNTDSIYRNTALEARLLVRTVVKADVLSGILITLTNISFPANVGKCDHENSCGYHYTPKEYFKDNPVVLEMDEGSGKSLLSAPYKTADKTPSCIVPSYIPLSYVLRSQSHYSINPLYQYLCHVFGEDETDRLFGMYRIGTSSK